MDDWLPVDGDLMFNLTNSTNASCPLAVTEAMHSTWVFTAFGECVTNVRQYLAFFIGLSSILFWLVAQAPQLVTNCRYGKADTALSFWFLLQWFAGDVTNLVGAILTDQLATQIVTAVYFVLIDSLMMTQFLYYLIKNQGVKGLTSCCPGKKAVLVLIPGVMCTLLWSLGPGASLTRQPHSPHRLGRVLLAHTGRPPLLIETPKYLTGYILGIFSALLYVGSRVPQIVKNFARCSVDGLSLPMFILAVLGNVTYALGIFLFSTKASVIIPALPWIVGSVGTLMFDFTIFTQFIIIRWCGCNRKRQQQLANEEIEKGSDDERRPLIPPTNGWCPPNMKGSIQQQHCSSPG